MCKHKNSAVHGYIVKLHSPHLDTHVKVMKMVSFYDLFDLHMVFLRQ